MVKQFPKSVDVESLEHAADCFRNCAGMIDQLLEGETKPTIANIQRVVQYCELYGDQGSQRASDCMDKVPDHLRWK